MSILSTSSLKSAPALSGNGSDSESKALRLKIASPLLLFRQVCLLTAMAGILSSREPAQGLLLFLFIWLLALPKSRAAKNTLFLAAAFFCGLFYAQARQNTPPPMPEWLHNAVALVQKQDGSLRRPPPFRIHAKIKEVTPQNGNRLRIILTDIAPAQSTESLPEAVYGGDIVWTWVSPVEFPLAGASTNATLRLAPVRDMANPGSWSTEAYWQDRNVFLKAWSKGNAADLHMSVIDVPWHTRLREKIRSAFIQTLFTAQKKYGTHSSTTTSPALPDVEEDDSGPAQKHSGALWDGHKTYTSLSPGAAMLPALLFGDRSFITPEDADRFARGTLAHSIALSGLHMGYAISAGFLLAWFAGFLFPSILLRIPRPKLSILFALPLAIGYLWLGQAPVSLTRAAFMFAFWGLLLFLYRPKVMLDGLIAAVAALLLLDPAALFDLSLQLSAISVAVIALVLPGIQRILSGIPATGRGSSILRGALTLLLISFSIQVALAPLTIRAFGLAGIWFPLNLVWLPILGAWTMPLSFAALLGSAAGLQEVPAFLVYLASLPGDYLFTLLNLLDSKHLLYAPAVLRPHWLTIAGFWAFFPALVMLTKTFQHKNALLYKGFSVLKQNILLPQKYVNVLLPTILLFLSLTCILLPLYWSHQEASRYGVRMYVLDVGQGQAVLIEWGGLPSSGRILIDGGGFPPGSFDVGKAVVAPALTDNRRPVLDAVINTHPDTDHLAGLIYILKTFTVGTFIDNSDTPASTLKTLLSEALAYSQVPHKTLMAGDVLNLAPGLTLETLWPPSGFFSTRLAEKNANQGSLIFRLIWEGQPLALLCGDAEPQAIRELLRTKADLEAPVLLLPHHGSGRSALPEFYQAVRPALAIASCGYGNPWGFPSPKAVQLLNKAHIPLYSTSFSGQIRVEWSSPHSFPSHKTTRFSKKYEKSFQVLPTFEETE